MGKFTPKFIQRIGSYLGLSFIAFGTAAVAQKKSERKLMKKAADTSNYWIILIIIITVLIIVLFWILFSPRGVPTKDITFTKTTNIQLPTPPPAPIQRTAPYNPSMNSFTKSKPKYF